MNYTITTTYPISFTYVYVEQNNLTNEILKRPKKENMELR